MPAALPGPCPVVFDLDGTLIDSAPDIRAAVNATLAERGLTPLSQDRIRSFIGGGVEALWQQIVVHLGLPAGERPALLASFMTRYQRGHGLTTLYPGVVEALGALADAGHPLGLCTNKPMAAVRGVLDHFGMTRVFASVIAGDSLPQRKPAPEPLWACVAALAGRADAPALFVGDSEFDADCARTAAVPLLLYTRGYRRSAPERLGAAATFDSYAALPALVQRMSAG